MGGREREGEREREDEIQEHVHACVMELLHMRTCAMMEIEKEDLPILAQRFTERHYPSITDVIPVQLEVSECRVRQERVC